MVAIWRKNMQSRPCDHFMRHLRVTKSCWSVFRSHKSLFPLKNCCLVMWCTSKWQRILRVSEGARHRQLRYKCVRIVLQSGAGYKTRYWSPERFQSALTNSMLFLHFKRWYRLLSGENGRSIPLGIMSTGWLLFFISLNNPSRIRCLFP